MLSKSEKAQQKIDLLMQEVPELPKGFDNWIIKSAFKNSRYIFYKKIGSKAHGLCSHCANEVEVPKAKHLEKGRCPSCKSKITYRAINKAKHYEDSEIISIAQKMSEDMLIIRYFRATIKFKKFEDDTSSFPNCSLFTLTNPEMSFYEGSREIFKIQKNGKTVYRDYEELWDYRTSSLKWKKERRRSRMFNKELLRDSSPFIYKKNLKGVLKNTKWMYSGIDYLKQSHMNIGAYLHTYEECKAVEILAKLDYRSLLNEIVYEYNWRGSIGAPLKKNEIRLGLSKNVFNTGLRLGLRRKGLELLSTLEELNKSLKDEQILWVVNNINHETFIQINKWIPTQKIINYIEKYHGGEKKLFAAAWRDYLEQCEILNLDMRDTMNLLPRDLYKKHEEYSELIKVIENEKINDGIKKQYEKWNQILSYAAGSLRVEVASSHKSIIEEGKALKHCVGSSSYAKNMASGGKLILFIRKNNKPYYTVEFDHREMKIIQNRGLKNIKANKEVEKFVKKWKLKRLLNAVEMQSKAM